MGVKKISNTPETNRIRWAKRDWAMPLRIIVGIVFTTIVVLTIAQIFFRFVLNSPLIWSEELVRLLIVWMTFIGAAVICWDGRHLSVDVGFVRFPSKIRRALRLFNCLVALAFLGLLVWYSIPIVELSMYVTIGAMDLPEAAYRVPATIGGVLMIIFIVLRIFLRWPRPGWTTEKADEDSVM